jgi:chemotaxis protein CheD
MDIKSNKAYQISSAEHIHRHHDKNLDKTIVTLSPGGFHVTDQDEVISTVLGSCVCVCVHDVTLKIGGMNHFMVPGGDSEHASHSQEELLRLGNYSMPHLLDQMYSMGAKKHSLEVKVFGGGAIISTAGEIGSSNIDFIQRYIMKHQLNLVSHHLGGQFPRKVNYFPITGQVYVKRLRALHKRIIAKREE